MEIGQRWDTICRVFDEAYKSCYHFAVATVNEDGSPHVTPIGGLFLREDGTGFFFEEFPSVLPKNLARNPRISVLAVNADKVFWGKALVEGKFVIPPGARLSGTAGPVRDATAEEMERWQKKVGFLKATRGYKIMWEGMRRVRDIKFDSYEPIFLGEMTRGL